MLESKRLYIRSFEKSDWNDLYEYLSLQEIYRFEPGAPITEKEAQKLTEERSKTESFKAVILKENKKMIGHLYFNHTQPEHFMTWELGYIFNPKFYNFGYATEASREIIRYAFAELKAHRIIANCNPNNTPSWKLLEKIGMRKEGFFKKKDFFRRDEKGNPLWLNCYQYAILEEEIKVEK